MSSRALRRLEKREAEQLAADPVVEDEPVIMSKKTQNLFALMNDDDDDDDDDEESGKNATSEENDQEPSEPVKVVLTTKSQRKKKKKAQKKGKRANTPAEDEDDNDGTNTAEDDEFDRLLKEHGANNQQVIDTTANLDGDVDNELELNITHPNIDPSYRYFTPRKQVACAKLLSVDVKDLDPDNEFKKLFGKLSQEAIDDADSTTSTSIPPEQLQQIKKLARVI
ncbi:Ribosome quality control complex subunit 1 [Cyberlindnera fabianii]|uniref:Ribosome quality control complex subunit 1 n=1 Tax=Cyberlindnera fabianii TaxID=36022 RepID=A0A1V2L3F9_CYBFA|nr:Ribosome quality control complex subunit 1 [Cyberlindnera fabianii]